MRKPQAEVSQWQEGMWQQWVVMNQPEGKDESVGYQCQTVMSQHWPVMSQLSMSQQFAEMSQGDVVMSQTCGQ